MLLSDLAFFWKCSGRNDIGDPMSLLNRARYSATAFLTRDSVNQLLRGDEPPLLAKMMAERPEFSKFVVSPYINAQWSVSHRIEQFIGHIRALEEFPGQFDFGLDQSVNLLDLGRVGLDEYELVIDKPIWFHREGVLTLNLFRQNIRLFSLSFSLYRQNNILGAVIGGVQGRKLPNILDEYRSFTKIAFGVRPRDFVIEQLRSLCRSIGVRELMAISDECRHQRHSYFSRDTDRELPLDYNEVWLDRGGTRLDQAFFQLPLTGNRDLDAVPAKKRSMYRNRFAMLEELENAMVSQLPSICAVKRPDAE